MRDEIPPNVPSYHLFTQPTDPKVLAERSRAWSGDEFSFHDLLDVINPLQHLPIVSTIYRYVTGDSIGAVPRIVGDAIFGGPIGFLTGLIGAVVKQESGEDLGEHAMALLTGKDSLVPSPATALADAAANAKAATDAATPAAAAFAAASPVAVTRPGAAASPEATAAAPAAKPAPGGIPLAPLHPAGAAATDGRGFILARADMLHRQAAASIATRPVPPEGFALPQALARGHTIPIAAAPVADAGAGVPPLPPGLTLPENPPIDISQQMLDALDKYARLHQQKGQSADAVRGTRVDVSQ